MVFPWIIAILYGFVVPWAGPFLLSAAGPIPSRLKFFVSQSTDVVFLVLISEDVRQTGMGLLGIFW